jgi:hypothetical protein
VLEIGLDERQRFVDAETGAPDGRPNGGREVRWSARRKQEVVLRLLRGESLDALARETASLPRPSARGGRRSWRAARRA